MYCLKLNVRKNNNAYYENKDKGDGFMNKDNKVLLEKVINDRLNKALEDNDDTSTNFNEAMEAIDRQKDLDSDKREKLIKLVEIGAAVIVTPIIEAKCRKVFAEMICSFEKDYTFTTTAGKALSKLFRL